MPCALTIPPLDEATSAELRHRYDTTDDPEDRLRYQMVWLAHGAKHAPEIAQLVLRSEDTVVRVLHRYLAGGLDAVPRRPPRRNADRHPGLGGRTAAGYRPRPAGGRGPKRQLDDGAAGCLPGRAHRRRRPCRAHRRRRPCRAGASGPARPRLCLQAPDLDAPAPRQRPGGLPGKRLRVEARLAGALEPAPPPLEALVAFDLLSDRPAAMESWLVLLPQADRSLQDEVQIALHPTLTRGWCRTGRRGQRLVAAPGTNATGDGFGRADWRAGWVDGRLAPGRTAAVFCDQVRAAVARSPARGRVAIGVCDNAGTPTAAGSKLVPALVAALADDLRLVYTPAYDPDANRLEWLWRPVRRAVTPTTSGGRWRCCAPMSPPSSIIWLTIRRKDWLILAVPVWH